MVLPLNYMNPGETASVVWLASDPCARQLLTDLGFVPGEKLQCIHKPFRKNMGAYRVRGVVLALRREYANEIFVKIPPVPSSCHFT